MLVAVTSVLKEGDIMTVDAVSSSLGAASSPLRTRQSEPDPQAQQTLQALQAQRDQARVQRQASEQTRDEAESPRPTVNAEGQTVGTRINITA